MGQYAVAIMGATGLVGEMVRLLLEERSFPVRDIRLMASASSVGQRLAFRGQEIAVEALSGAGFEGVDLVFSCVSRALSKDLAPKAVKAGATVIDKSDAFRMDPAVPLVVPEVNAADLAGERGIVASPNCSTIPLVMVLKPLLGIAPLERVVVSTYQSVSGAGRDAEVGLRRQTEAWLDRDRRPDHSRPAASLAPISPVFTEPIAFNLVPSIGAFSPMGDTEEETKLLEESRKILHVPGLRVTATAVRVPVFVGHSESVNLEFGGPVEPLEARQALSRAPGVVILDEPSAGSVPTPRIAAGKDDVFVGRIRRDASVPHGLNLWLVTDNLRKGAATNAVQIAEALIAVK